MSKKPFQTVLCIVADTNQLVENSTPSTMAFDTDFPQLAQPHLSQSEYDLPTMLERLGHREAIEQQDHPAILQP